MKVGSIILLFVFLITRRLFINASVVMLFERPNFYELEIKRADDVHATNFEQSFSYLVGANGKCSSSMESILKLEDDYPPSDYEGDHEPIPEDFFNLDANILIYSNYEETMSFIIEIKFNSLKKIQKFEGFEIVFQQNIFNVEEISCIQLVPLKKEFLNLQNNFKIRIKDPSFMSFRPTHIFHYGHVFVRPLVQCNLNQAVTFNGIKMCPFDDLRSRKKEIGIENKANVNIRNLNADICPGHLMDQTCIIKYEKFDTYYMILQPYTPFFYTVLGDINFYTLTPSQQDLKKDAEKNLKSYIKIGPVDYSSNITDGEFMHHIELMSRQKIFNGLIMKLVKYKDEAIHYMSVLKNPSSANPCANNVDKSYCYCKTTNECKPCFYPDSSITESNNYYYLALNYDKNPQHYKSSPCYKHPFFEPYFNLEKLEMAQYFQNKNLSSIKKVESQSHKNVEILTPIRDYIPRVCLNLAYGSNKNYFDLKMIFNDYYRTGLSSLFEGTKYKFKLYSYTYNDAIEHDLYFERKFFHKINPQFIYDEPNLIESTDLIHIENLICGAYIMEITPYQKTIYCPTNTCLVESPTANTVQCVKCNKLVVHFLLENGMIRVSPDIMVEPVKNGNRKVNNNNNKNSNPKNSNPLRYSSLASKTLKVTVHKSVSLNKDDSIYKCSIDGNTVSYNGNSFTNNINNIINIRSKFDKYKIYSSAIPNDIDLSSLTLPYIHVPDQQTDNGDYFVLKIISITGLSLITFLLIIITLFCVVKQPQWEIKKQVVFYLSIDVEPEMQRKLGKLIDKYIQRLKKNFSKMEFHNFGYHTPITLRNEVIERCDLIFYVCGTQKEIEKLNNKYIGFGTNTFQHDYNKMHFLKSFENKCFNITFNETVKELDENQFECRHINTNNEIQSSFKSIYSKIPQATVVSPTSNGRKAIVLNRANYLKLPENNGHLIALIAQKIHFDLVADNLKYDQRNRKRSNKLISYLNDLYFSNNLKQLKRSLDSESRKYLKANKVLLTLNQNIDHDIQPIQINIIEEFENDLEESQQDQDSIKTFDSSSTSSYSKNSNNSAS